MTSPFRLVSPFSPTGDQPEAIDAIVSAFASGRRFATLQGVTGSGKTFSIANVIRRLGLPTLLISHNKTLAAQLFAELKDFFPDNAVHYFISYYDYYQPEAYIPQTDTYIEKDASTNEEIERLRLAATDALVQRSDVIVVASVSCIYGLGSPEDYRDMLITLRVGDSVSRDSVMQRLVAVQYERNDVSMIPGTFRARGDTLDVFPSYSVSGVRIEFFGDSIERIRPFDPVSGHASEPIPAATFSPAKHFVMPEAKIEPGIRRILDEMEDRVRFFEKHGKLLEAQRIRMRTSYDMEMLREIGFCSGIENYSRPLGGRPPGSRPQSLLDFFPRPFFTVIDESHVTLPQIRAMFNGDQIRKRTLVEHGFRLPSALDNRPMAFDEFLAETGQILFSSATPSPLELQFSGPPVQQILRPTGILDPSVELRPLEGQIDDLIAEIRACVAKKQRVLVTTLTKKTAEELADYLQKLDIRAKYLHSDITALERVSILRGLRKAEFDVLIGINLLREGLDLPEVALVAILDADKEGFLRSETSLVQTAGRAARHLEGRVILYADNVTGAMRAMMDATADRRRRQQAWNDAHHIAPKPIVRPVREDIGDAVSTAPTEESVLRESGADYDVEKAIADLEREMVEASNALEFERAALLRDQIVALRGGENPYKGIAPQKTPLAAARRASAKGKSPSWLKKTPRSKKRPPPP